MDAVADHELPSTLMVIVTPSEGWKMLERSLTIGAYTPSFAYQLSWAVARLRRSDFITASWAVVLVPPNRGMAIVARIPMITTTMRSSMRVKPLGERRATI